MSNTLFDPYTLGSITLRNRVVMAPLTRCRATADHIPTELMATYYQQRATAGLIITEGTAPSPNGLGYARTPGLYSPEQVRGWKKITEAVHTAGGHIFVQLMHTGRVSHPLNMPSGARILAPSAIALKGSTWTDQEGMQPHPVPGVMTEADIQQAIGEYATSAALALEAGFDGVELHGANGYLIEQFLNTASNQRTDRWGGSIENRARFAIEVATAVSQRIGAKQTGIRLSPYGVFNDMVADAETEALYLHLAAELSKLELAYIHLVDHSSAGAPEVPAAIKASIRERFHGAIILSGGYDRRRADTDLAANRGDLIAYGKPLIANPDLVQRLKEEIALNPVDPDTFYTPGAKGYTDYPLASHD